MLPELPPQVAENSSGMKLQEALELTAKVLVKTMDTASPTAERLEFGIVPWQQ